MRHTVIIIGGLVLIAALVGAAVAWVPPTTTTAQWRAQQDAQAQAALPIGCTWHRIKRERQSDLLMVRCPEGIAMVVR